MMRFWRSRPIKQKLIWITMLASSSALLFAAAAFVSYDMTTYRHTLASDLLIRLKVLEINNAAPLAFQDRGAARENLAPLRADPRLVAAVIYDKNGHVFADYRRSSEALLPPDVPGGEGERVEGNHLDLYLPVQLDGEVIGHIAIRADLTEQQARLRSLLMISAGVLLASFVVAFLIASKLQTTISNPIMELTHVAHRVSQQKDYTVQAVRRGHDEIGTLADGLNEMLAQIHDRDQRLRHHSETLEKQVTERTADLSRVNETLRESESRYRHLVDHANDIICRTDTEGRLIYFNPTAMRITKYSSEELLGRCYLDLVHPRHRQAAERMYLRQLARKVYATAFEFPLIAKDGAVVWLSQNVQLLLENDAVIGFQAIARDISERKQVEEALQEAHNALEQLVLDRTAELRQTVERLSNEMVEREQAESALQASQGQIRQMQKMEAIGQLAGGIAHDFNNILTAILGNAEIALVKIEADHPVRLNLTRILEAGRRASDVVQQILTFTRQQGVSRVVTSLVSVVTEVLGLLRATLPAGIELTSFCEVETPHVLADVTQLHQVLMNLCTNAWHALGEHSGHIDVTLAPVTLTQPLYSLQTKLPPGRYARLSVRDTGCGMDSETVQRIFDPFFTTKPVGQGTGLGLSVVHGIMQGHDGAIVVETAPGQGTTFHLYFPEAAEPAALEEPTAALRIAMANRTCHLLYLDDEEMLVELVRALFEPLGYRVTGCTKAAEALAAIRADPSGIDVVVTDYNMPEMSGLEVARELAQIHPTLPVVLVSGFLTLTDQDAALASNIKEIVYKPTMLQELGGVLTRLVDLKQQG